VTEQATRYDKIALGYARWWAPVLAPTAVTVLDRIEPLVAAGARQILDIGTGTATLALAAIERWPQVNVTGLDASSGMAEAARAQADRRLGPADRRRFEVRVAFADRMPFADGSFDAAVSSFVLQLVPSRAAVLREAHRVVRRDGRLAHVTWLAASRAFQPDIEFDAALEEIGEGAREPDGRSGDYRSVGAAAAELRRAGFRGVSTEERELVHAFEPLEYEKFLEEFDEEDLFSSLEPELRDRLKRDLRRRLGRLPPDAFRLRLPVVTASGTRS